MFNNFNERDNMRRFLRHCVLAAVSASALSAPASAAVITMNFESFPGPDGILGTADDVSAPNTFLQPLRDQYASLGVTFTQGTLLQDNFMGGAASNHFISSTYPIGVFSVPVLGIRIDSRSFWDAFLTAYDVNGNILAQDVLLNPNAGWAPLAGQLSLTSLTPIHRFSVMANNADRILNLDNLVLTTAEPSAEVPEPQTLAMFGLGLAMLGATARRRSRK
ncbi:PEP-CTERM sorting domain-containing protein [Massilia niabensis]|uniref:PEP-CTERM sorting domain-containing protein n=1 Tax=Massilia niabensis TaxID=544910 RepID=A0ABW0L5B1_9BURK